MRADGEQTTTTVHQPIDSTNFDAAKMPPNTPSVGSAPTMAGNEGATDNKSWWTTGNAMTISAAILVFGVLVLVLLALVVRKKTASTDDLLKLFMTPLVIIMAVFLVVAGYSDQQITPVMTLLGTIVGFLFGRHMQSGLETETKKESTPTGQISDIEQPSAPTVSINKQPNE